jgi:uncharacterized membrane protein
VSNREADAAFTRPSRSGGTMPLAVTRYWSGIVLSAGAVGWALLFAVLAARRHDAYLSHRFDLGNMTQVVWNTAHGHFLEMTSTSGDQIVRLGIHVDPLLAAFAPIWWVWPSPVMLTTIQAFALAAGALPVYWLSRKHTGDRRAAVNLAAAYLLFPAVQWSAFNDFHPVTLSIPCLLFFVWYLDEDRLVAAAVFALLAVLSKEQIPLVIAGIGVWYAMRRDRRREGFAIAGLGIAWTAIALDVVIPHFSGGPSRFYDRFESVGGSPRGILTTLVTDPGHIWSAATTGADLRYLAALCLPLLGLWALEPLLALAAAPVLGINLLSDFWSMNRIEYQYASAIVACLFAAAAIGAGRLGSRRAFVVTTLVLATVAITSVAGPLGAIRTYGAGTRPSATKIEVLNRAVGMIPASAPVSASNNVGAHLSERRRIFSFPIRSQANWVIVDRSDPWLADAGEENNRSLYAEDLRALQADDSWRRVFHEDGVSVFRRVGHASPPAVVGRPARSGDR